MRLFYALKMFNDCACILFSYLPYCVPSSSTTEEIMNTFFEVASAFLALLVFILLGIMSICALTYYVGTKPACEQYGRLTGAQISTQFFGDGCLVKYEGKWVDYSVATQKKQEIKVSQ